MTSRGSLCAATQPSGFIRALVTVLMVFLLGHPIASFGQQTTATFAGIVIDSSGALLPGANIQLANEGTSAVKQQLSGDTGEFLFTFIPVGNYTLSISKEGFKTLENRGIELGAAQSVRRTFSLDVGAITESVSVNEDAPLVNALSAEQRVSIETLQVKNLPMYNRNMTNILDIGTGLNRDETGQAGGKGAQRLRLNGLGGSAMTITADGTNGSMNGGSAASISGYGGYNKIDVMSAEAIAEIQIVKGAFPAEYGFTMGGNLSLISKSGTNSWHGSLFHRYEGAVLSARNAFLAARPKDVWNQFGGSVGGPIWRDKAFFFVAYEGYRQRSADPLSAVVPTPAFRDIILKGLKVPEAQLMLNFYPLPNGSYAPTDLLAIWNGAAPKEYDDDHVDFKIDYTLFTGNLSVSSSLGHPFASRAAALPTNPDVFRAQSERGSVNYVLGRSRWTAATRIGYNRAYEPRDATWNTATVVPGNRTEVTPGGLRVGAFTYPGMTSLSGRVQHRGLSPSYSVEQQFSLIRGQHSWKFGGILNLRSGGKTTIDPEGLAFQTLADVQNNTPSSVSYAPGINPYRFRAHDFGFFAQDDWRVNQRLVLNLGLRYDRFDHITVTPFHDNLGACICNQGPLLDANKMTWGPVLEPKNPFPSDNLSLGPRFGFAYKANNKGDFVIRGGFGIGFQGFDEQTFTTNIAVSPSVPSSRVWTRAEAVTLGLKFPVYRDDLTKLILSQAAGTATIGTRFDTNFHPPYAMNFTLGLQHALWSGSVLEAAYVGTRGVKFTLDRPFNTPDRITAIRPNPNDINGTYIDGSQQTDYNSLQVSLKQRLLHGILYGFNYTWGKGLGYTGGDVGQSFSGDTYGGIEDFNQVKIERGPNAGDVAHAASFNWVYEVPTPFRTLPIAKYALSGWEIAGIMRAQSGQPIIVTQTGGRPDIADPGAAIGQQCCGFSQIQWLNPAAFQLVPVSVASARTIRRGNLGTAALRGPGFYNLDLSLGRVFKIRDKHKVDLRADLSNSLNHTEYFAGGIQTNMSSPGFGRLNAARAARTIQLQLRYTF